MDLVVAHDTGSHREIDDERTLNQSGRVHVGLARHDRGFTHHVGARCEHGESHHDLGADQSPQSSTSCVDRTSHGDSSDSAEGQQDEDHGDLHDHAASPRRVGEIAEATADPPGLPHAGHHGEWCRVGGRARESTDRLRTSATGDEDRDQSADPQRDRTHVHGVDENCDTGERHRTRMAADREGDESGRADERHRGLPPRRRQSPFSIVVVGRHDENQEHESGDQNETDDRPDTETCVEDATPDIGVDQAGPTGRLEIHAVHRKMNQGGESEYDERSEHHRSDPPPIDEPTHEERQPAEGRHHGEERDPTDDRRHRVNTGGTRSSGQNSADQLADVDATRADRPDGERERALHHMAVARHHTPRDHVDAVGQGREPREHDRGG